MAGWKGLAARVPFKRRRRETRHLSCCGMKGVSPGRFEGGEDAGHGIEPAAGVSV